MNELNTHLLVGILNSGLYFQQLCYLGPIKLDCWQVDLEKFSMCSFMSCTPHDCKNYLYVNIDGRGFVLEVILNYCRQFALEDLLNTAKFVSNDIPVYII